MDGLVDRLESLLTSPWGLLVIFGVCVVDAFFPVVPSETLVITGGVFAASGDLNLAAVIAVGACGAVSGDHLSYGIGRVVGRPAVDRMSRRKRLAEVRDRAQRALDGHGGPALIALRFVPGRTLAEHRTGRVSAVPGAQVHPLRARRRHSLGRPGRPARLLRRPPDHDNYAIATAAGIVISIALAGGIELVGHRVLAGRRRRAAA